VLDVQALASNSVARKCNLPGDHQQPSKEAAGVTETIKVCRSCKQEKRAGDFYGREAQCKSCRWERTKEIRASGHKERTPPEVKERGNRMCRVCREERPVSDFIGKNAKCKECFGAVHREQERERRKVYRAANIESERQKDRDRYRKWKQTRPEGWRRAVKNGRLKEQYGITINDLDRMIEACNATCEICREVQLDPYKMHVDHCHSTGAIRGLICGKCNVGIGMFRDNPENLVRAAEYLSRT
jgi:hypothetical protein